MKWRIVAALTASVLCVAPSALAHRIDEYLQATLLSLTGSRMEASMRLVPGVLVAPAVIAAIDTNHDGTFSESEKHAYAERVLADLSITVDGKHAEPELTSLRLPQPADLRDGLGEIHIDYVVHLPPGGPERKFTLEDHHLQSRSVYLVNAVMPKSGDTTIIGQMRNERQSSYTLDFEQTGPLPHSAWSNFVIWQRGLQLSNLFQLGMRHIAEGTDHLLFLLVLLLPVPLIASGSRWMRTTGTRQGLLHVIGIVTAFTLGHSVTLTLAALGFVHVPERPVEVLIAVSILISAVHALRPIFPGREAYIAAFFGLIHGLAFASTLARLGLARWDRVAGVLAFNLGIEAMQMLVVVAVVPSLLLMSRTRAYPGLRVSGAVCATLAALCWIVERLLNVQTPVDEIVNTIAHHALGLAVGLMVVSLTCRWLLPSSEPLDNLHGWHTSAFTNEQHPGNSTSNPVRLHQARVAEHDSCNPKNRSLPTELPEKP